MINGYDADAFWLKRFQTSTVSVGHVRSESEGRCENMKIKQLFIKHIQKSQHFQYQFMQTNLSKEIS